jgi:HK97 family phage prohead protease
MPLEDTPDLQTKDFAIKAVDQEGHFEGWASTYGNKDQDNEIVERGAFTKNLQDRGPDRPLLWSHFVSKPIGVVHLKDTQEGLAVRGELDLDTQDGRDAHRRLKKKIVRGMSIGYRILKDEFVDGARVLKELLLFEVSLVVLPANPRARITAVKSISSIRDFERFLHESGYSRSEASRLALHGYKGLELSEPDPQEELAAAWLAEQNARLRA